MEDTGHEIEKAKPAISELVTEIEPAPEGGLRAWLVVLGSALLIFCTMGFANSFGTLFEYYASDRLKGTSSSDIAWIGSLSMFLQFFGGMFGGPLFDRFGAKVIWPACVIYVFALFMLSLCYQYWQFVLAQGILMGTVMGLIQFPAYTAASQYFEKKRAAALGLVISGSSIGGVVMPIALSRMLNSSSLGFGWSIRVIAFLVLPLLLFACLVVRARVPPRKTQFWILSLYTEPQFLMLIAAMFFLFAGSFTPFFYLPSYATTQGMDPTTAGYLPAVLNGASTFGRIALGISADKLGRLNVFAVGALGTAIMVFCLSSVHSSAGFFTFAAFYGIASGSVVSAGSAAFSVCAKDIRNVGTYMGMGMAISGIGVLIGPPINGVLLREYDGNYLQVSMFSGALCLAGGLIAAATKLTTTEGLFGRI